MIASILLQSIGCQIACVIYVPMWIFKNYSELLIIHKTIYLFFHTAFRLSTNAFIPSFWSSVS